IVTDEDDCSSSVQVTIGVVHVIAINAIVTNEDCGEFNGNINVSVTGGSGNYSYQWSNGEVTQSIGGLQYGTYSVIVSDTTGCTVSQTYTVGVNGSLGITVDPPFATIEAGDSIQIVASG